MIAIVFALSHSEPESKNRTIFQPSQSWCVSTCCIFAKMHFFLVMSEENRVLYFKPNTTDHWNAKSTLRKRTSFCVSTKWLKISFFFVCTSKFLHTPSFATNAVSAPLARIQCISFALHSHGNACTFVYFRFGQHINKHFTWLGAFCFVFLLLRTHFCAKCQANSEHSQRAHFSS